MKLVNPFGRSVNSELYTDSGVEPMACMCSGSSACQRHRPYKFYHFRLLQ